MAGKPFREGPEYIGTTGDDIYVPGTGTYALVYHIHVANTTGTAALVSLYIGSTGAETGGTELCKDHSIPANDEKDFYFPAGLKLATTDFLVGDADGASELAVTVTGELFAA